MTKEEYINFVKESYKEIFKDKYDEKRAMDSAEAILVESDNDVDKAKAAAEVIIARTKAKMTASEEKHFDAKPMIEVKLGGKTVSICPKTGAVMVDGKLSDMKVDTKMPISEIYGKIAEKLGVENKPTEGKIKLHDALDEVKNMIKDAPAEVKKSFNEIVNHLAGAAEKKEFCNK